MADEGFKRKLTAVLSADAVGYSRLMAEDEAATVKTIATYREIMSTLIKQHRGRVVDSPGDNMLAEFSSVVDAVQCAVAVQNEFETRNAELAKNRRMEFRIGINLGDVIDEEDRIYGKVIGEKRFLGRFSRRTALAAIVILVVVAGGLISWNIYLQQQKKVEPASVEKMAFPLPDKPSIAVLPFDNMSGDPQQDHFSDGITEQIITSLSKVPYIFVIARNSTFTYKAKPVKVNQVAEELGVQYVLEGSVQRSNDKVRITAQLIDAIAGHHVWAENYDRQIKDIFALQDDIAMKIMAAMQVKLTVKEWGRLSAIKTKNLKAYKKYLMAYEHLWRRTEADSQQAKILAQEAISLDPEYGAAYQLLARTHTDDVWYYRTKSAAKSLETAEQLVQKSIDLSGPDSDTHQILGMVYYLRRQYDKAIAECQKAVVLSPNSAEANFRYGHALRYAGRFDEAIPIIEKAIRLNPFTPMVYINNLAWVYAFSEQYEKAISLWDSAIKRNPDYFFAYLGLTLVYQLTGNEAKAREAASEVMRLKPNLTVSRLAKGPATKGIDRKRMLDQLRKAGIPE
jgi:adenylate cyclase